MERVKPQVFHIGETRYDAAGIDEFLAFHGISEWDTNAHSDAEFLIELCGRRCYQSWETAVTSVTKKNANLSRVRVGNDEYINNILSVGHGSVIEHASDTYAMENVSRVFCHEVVRHRLCAFSQESLRFVRPTSLRAYFPDVFNHLPEKTRAHVNAIFEGCFEELENVQKQLVEVLGMDEMKRTFSDKKKLQSAMRRLMPIGMATGIIVTTNHRNWRHLIAMRTAEGAEEEIRIVFLTIARDLRNRYPALYQDLEVSANGACTFGHGRV